MCQRPDENSEGGQIDRYRIVRTIGHGRLSVVYEVLDEDGTRLALRVLSTAIEGDDVAFERFRREALMAERIVHPNVVPVLGHGETGGRPYVVLRLMTGGSLADLIAAGPMPLERLVTLLLGVATGVDAVHARGLVHRDIKPENILLDENGTALISDFVLAKDTEGDDLTLTRPGQALGSLDYIAPEQIRGRPVSAATDVYSLACVAWAGLTGAPPFADRPSMRVLFAHLQEQPRDLGALCPYLSPATVRAVTRGLEKDPHDRPRGPLAYVQDVAYTAGISV